MRHLAQQHRQRGQARCAPRRHEPFAQAARWLASTILALAAGRSTINDQHWHRQAGNRVSRPRQVKPAGSFESPWLSASRLAMFLFLFRMALALARASRRGNECPDAGAGLPSAPTEARTSPDATSLCREAHSVSAEARFRRRWPSPPPPRGEGYCMYESRNHSPTFPDPGPGHPPA